MEASPAGKTDADKCELLTNLRKLVCQDKAMEDFLGFAVVSEDEAKETPYPYVYIEKDGSYSELNDEAKQYLEMKFHPADGARPYVKTAYKSTTANGDTSGFLDRKQLPKTVKRKA